MNLRSLRKVFQNVFKIMALLSLTVILTGFSTKESQEQFDLGNRYFKEADYQKAIEAYRSAIRSDPKNVYARSNLGLALRELGRYEEAIADFKQAIEISKENIKAFETNLKMTKENMRAKPNDRPEMSPPLSDSELNRCYECHRKFEQRIKSFRYLHTVVKEKRCYACHYSYDSGSDQHKVIMLGYPEEYYKPFKVNNYALCFQCHRKEMVLEPFKKEVTNFRNCDLNLHFKHVNKTPKGRSCKSCHDAHGGDQLFNIIPEVPFGNPRDGKGRWMLPIKYEKTETGGSCQVGCHKKKFYDRGCFGVEGNK